MIYEAGLYIHIPFCLKKCSYCNFNSFSGANIQDQKDYCDAVKKEINAFKGKDLKVKTIYVGGGTPTILDGSVLEGLLKHIKQAFDVLPDAEITMEANPKTIDADKLNILKASGFNRLSIGMQDLSDKILKTLGRVHNRQDFLEAYKAARKAGFNNVNVDIIYGVPEQSISKLKDTLKEVIELNPEHISAYGLTYEENTPMIEMTKSGKLKRLSEETEAEMFYLVKDTLETTYKHYEISNFAKMGFESRHNNIYWDNNDYLGIGAGACSRIEGVRRENIRDYHEYIRLIKERDSAILYSEQISKDLEIKEAVFLGLRKLDGINLKEWKTRYGLGFFDLFDIKVKKLVELGLLEASKENVKLTRKVLILSNEVFVEFV